MVRRVHTPTLKLGDNTLDPVQAHHLRAVLRLAEGDEVELFDNAGRSARGTLFFLGSSGAHIRVTAFDADAPPATTMFSIAAAVPKGERADWMVEKLSEFGASTFVPLAAARSVVLPEGKNKMERWQRIATESAKQSHRRGVMRIAPLTSVDSLLATFAKGAADPSGTAPGWYLSTSADRVSISAAFDRPRSGPLTALVGPEGGWTDAELAGFKAARLLAVGLTTTVLRVETAAIAVAAILGCWGSG